MIVLEKIMKELTMMKDVFCDGCGKSCKVEEDIFEYGTVSASWGYYSGHDEEKIEEQYCVDCLYLMRDLLKKDLEINKKANKSSIQHLLEKDLNEQNKK